MIVGAAAVALRLLGVDITALVEPVGPVVGLLIGFVGFLQLGLAVSLEPLGTAAATCGGPRSPWSCASA